MEKENSLESKQNPFKFNSELLNRPFSSRLKDKEQTTLTNSFNANQDIKFSTSFYNNDFHNHSKISSLTQSFSLTNKDFNELDEKNQSFQSDSARNVENTKTRKPFDKLSFTSSSLKNETDCSKKAMEDTELTYQKTSNEEMSNSLNTEYLEFEESQNLNKTTLTEMEKLFIKTQSQTLSKETFEKARLYNMDSDSDSIPFWIKFFSDIETQSLNSNSSYFKVIDKDKYIANLIEMVKRDAELYDATAKHDKAKKEVKNNIKSLLITEVAQSNKNTASKSNEENDLENNEGNLNTEANINGRLNQILNIYDKIEEKENNINKNFSLKNQLAGNKRSTSKTKEFTANLTNRTASKLLEINSELEYKLIENLNVNDSYDEFKEINYEDVDFGCFSHNSIKRLLEIDRKLNIMYPNTDVYKYSINTSLKNLARDFVKDKTQRLKEIDEKLSYYNKNQGVSSNSNSNSNSKSKSTIFDIKLENNEKVKYKDYMKEDKEKKEKQNKLDTIDNKINSVINGPVDEEKRKDLYKELEKFHDKNEDGVLIDESEDIVDKRFEEIQERQKMEEYFIEKFEENLKNTEKIHKEQIVLWKKELEGPYMELMSVIDEEYNENRIFIARAEEIDKNLENTERRLNEISKISRFEFIF